MQVTETLSDGLKRGFTVVVPAADIETKRAARFEDLSKTIRLPGFRPGKVPLPVVRQRYGSAVMAEVLEQSVNDATRQVMEERGLRPALQPKIDVVNMETGAGPARDLEFKVELEVLPEIPAPDLAAVQLTRLKAEATTEAVDERLKAMAQRNRTLHEIGPEELGGRGAATGELLTVDFTGKIDGQPFQGGEGKDIEVELGSGNFVPGWAEQLEGMKPGEARTIAVTFPADYGVRDLAGKLASFDVTAKKLSRIELPAIDDAFAQKLSFETLEELRDLLKRQVQQEYDSMSRLRLKRELLDTLAEQATFVAPDGMVEQEFNQIWQRLEAERKEGRLDADDQGKDEEMLRADYRAIAERRVRLGLLLAEIGRTNNLTVTPDELNRAMRAEAARYPGREAEMMEFFRKYPAMQETLRGPIFEEKVVDYVLELAKVEEKAVPLAELSRELPNPLAKARAAAAGEPAAAVAEGTGAAAEPEAAGAAEEPSGSGSAT